MIRRDAPRGRRHFLRGSLGLASLGLLAGCGMVPARPRTVHRIGFLGSNEFGDPLVEALRQGLHDLGRVDGRDLTFDVRFQTAGSDPLPVLAAELVRLRPDVFVVAGSEAALAAQAATSTIPVVIGSVSDPVGLGLVESLGRPGGNITGLSTVNTGLTRKRVELLAHSSAGIADIGIAWYSGSPPAQAALREAQTAAEHLGIRTHSLEVQGPAELEEALAGGVRGQVDALLVPGGPRMFADRARIVELTMRAGIPSIYSRKEWAEAGGLLSYGPDFAALYRRAASYVDKIISGARPADLPVEQADEYELVVNLDSARAMGLTIPDSLLAQATLISR